MREISVRQWQERFRAGDFSSRDRRQLAGIRRRIQNQMQGLNASAGKPMPIAAISARLDTLDDHHVSRSCLSLACRHILLLRWSS